MIATPRRRHRDELAQCPKRDKPEQHDDADAVKQKPERKNHRHHPPHPQLVVEATDDRGFDPDLFAARKDQTDDRSRCQASPGSPPTRRRFADRASSLGQAVVYRCQCGARAYSRAQSFDHGRPHRFRADRVAAAGNVGRAQSVGQDTRRPLLRSRRLPPQVHSECRSNMAAARIVASGLAIPCPAMSGAEP